MAITLEPMQTPTQNFSYYLFTYHKMEIYKFQQWGVVGLMPRENEEKNGFS